MGTMRLNTSRHAPQPLAAGGGGPLRLCTVDGGTFPAATRRWWEPSSEEDQLVLARVVAPVLDIGCGPGRHVVALSERGIDAFGLEMDPRLVDVARRRGADVLQGSVFDPLAFVRPWRSVLLLDGNLGIGGDPVRLLTRVRSLLGRCGRVLAELDPPGTPAELADVRLELAGTVGPFFRLARVPVDVVEVIAHRSGFDVADCWQSGSRYFTELVARASAIAPTA